MSTWHQALGLTEGLGAFLITNPQVWEENAYMLSQSNIRHGRLLWTLFK